MIQTLLNQLKIDYTPNGKDYMILCPFHEDRNASLAIRQDNGIFYCRSCHVGGNINKLIKKLKGYAVDISDFVSFEDLFKHRLENIYSDTLGQLNYYEAQLSFENYLKYLESYFISAEEHPISFEYLGNRGFTKETINHFKLQYCEFGEYSGRIIIPLYRGDFCIGFNSRLITVDKEHGKEQRYRYYVMQERFKDYIYNYQTSADHSTVILVEGAFDLMWLWQNGFKNIMSFLSSGSKPEQIMSLYGFKNIIFVYDNDENKSGDNAVVKTSEMIYDLFPEKNIFKASLPDFKDPNGCTVEEIKEALKNLKRIKLTKTVKYDINFLSF